jgi:hypothetical protein
LFSPGRARRAREIGSRWGRRKGFYRPKPRLFFLYPFLVETVRGRAVAELTMAAIEAGGLPTYAHKSSAKRAAQQMIDRVLDEP